MKIIKKLAKHRLYYHLPLQPPLLRDVKLPSAKMKTIAAILSVMALSRNTFASPVQELSSRGDHTQVLLCSGASASGNCVKWEMQTGHYCRSIPGQALQRL